MTSDCHRVKCLQILTDDASSLVGPSLMILLASLALMLPPNPPPPKTLQQNRCTTHYYKVVDGVRCWNISNILLYTLKYLSFLRVHSKNFLNSCLYSNSHPALILLISAVSSKLLKVAFFTILLKIWGVQGMKTEVEIGPLPVVPQYW